MRIVIDMQGAQSESCLRRFGPSTISLAQAIARNRGEHDIILAVNGLFATTVEAIRAAFAELLPPENIRLWCAPGPVDYLSAPKWRRDIAEHIRECFIWHLKPDIVLVTSLFEDFDESTVISIGKAYREIPTAVLLHDPAAYFRHFQCKRHVDRPVIDGFYLNRLDQLRRADLLLSTSEASRQDAIEHLGFDARAVADISTAADAQFSPRKIPLARERELRQRYRLERPFVMYAGGVEQQNLEALIRAYGRLPADIRRRHQLALVCTAPQYDHQFLVDLAERNRLTADDLILTDIDAEGDLVDLYNLCTVFAYPSYQERFPLPALEAMSCGAPVIGANTPSLAKVIGSDVALFDPHDDDAITARLSDALADEAFRRALARHGLEQAKNFSWERTAKLALAALARCVERRRDGEARRGSLSGPRPKLAYISPLPPERSGISDYSAELLPELSRYYDIEVVVAQRQVSDPYITAAFPVRSLAFFRSHAGNYDRVLYHFGNSPFHQHMFGLLQEFPGTVVLHDFFLSGAVTYLECYGLVSNAWTEELYAAHGYEAVRQRFHTGDSYTLWGDSTVGWRYPLNLSVLRRAQGVIVHSANSVRLAKQWYGKDPADWEVIPLLRDTRVVRDKLVARQVLGIGASDFLVCAFGQLGQVKLNHRLLQAWLQSDLARDATCHLVFVGENDRGEYGRDIRATIAGAPGANIRISDWVDMEVFRRYLAAADVAVQLRTLSRGETSAAVLDCMNYGLATIVNAHGSMADLDDNAVWKLPDEFSDAQLIEALEMLRNDVELRGRLGANGRAIILEKHSGRACAAQYREAIERFGAAAAGGTRALASAIAGLDCELDAHELTRISEAVARNVPKPFQARQLLVDISALVQRDVKTGIQRVVRAIMGEWLVRPPSGVRVEPVYATEHGVYRYARRFTLNFLKCPQDVLDDEPVEFCGGDILFIADFNMMVVEAQRAFYQQIRAHGVQVVFLVHDLLPVLMPQYFVDGYHQAQIRWLRILAENDGAVCVSKAVADALAGWLKQNAPPRQRCFKIYWSHHGADIENSAPTAGLPAEAAAVLDRLRSGDSFLMVGTLEPRKGHAQVVEAFDLLWRSGLSANLVIVGKSGWLIDDLLERLRGHPEFGKHLFWLEGISDEYLEKIYAASTCLIAASEAEGFGLPLIEAAMHKLPIIARDIPVFREVAGEHAFYFTGREPAALAASIEEWLGLYHAGQHPTSEAMPWLTWKESAERLQQILLRGDWYAAPAADSQQDESAAETIVLSFAPQRLGRQLLLDVSATCRDEFKLKTGIERVARAITVALLKKPPAGFRVEPIYLSEEGGIWHYRYARRFTLDLLGRPSAGVVDEPAKVQAGDVLLGLDNSGYLLIRAEAAGLFANYRSRGVAVYFTVYDLLPLRLPQYFPPDSELHHEKWLRALFKMDGLFCISRASADDLRDWALAADPSHRPPRIGWFHLGADIDSGAPTRGMPDEAPRVLAALVARPSFLMVGTIEPRKGHLQVLDAFDKLWSQGLDINLTIVGAEGWRHVPQELRRTIPQILERLQSHPELGRRLFWVNDASDEYLEKIYAASRCLIAASEGEGFGLPLIEAARHRLPIIARDLPVFHEVAGMHAFYFTGKEPDQLAAAVKEWLALCAKDMHPKSEALPWLTWTQSAEQLLGAVLRDYRSWRTGGEGRPALVAGNIPFPAVTQSMAAKGPAWQLLLDVSATCRTQLKTGIERVARAVTLGFFETPPGGFRVEPVYLSDEGGAWHYRYARRFAHALSDRPSDGVADTPVQLQAGDILLGLDFSDQMLIQAAAAGLFAACRNHGVALYFVVHDLLPLRLPHYFPPGTEQNHEKWLRAVLNMDGALCVSRTVADELRHWAAVNDPARERPFHVGWFHHGADIAKAAATRGLPEDAARNLAAFAARPTFLMVGTIEPRKGHLQAIDAFDELWSQGLDVNLTIVGADGWRNVPESVQLTIPRIVARLQSHPERGRRLFWLNGPSDEYLEKVYGASRCLIAASEGEGFGLPLIEAARHRLPIIARDIPVFHEVAGDHAFYFAGNDAHDLAAAVKQWLTLYEKGAYPKSDAMRWLTWKQAVERIKDILLGGAWYAVMPPAEGRSERQAEHDERLGGERTVRIPA